MRRRPQNLVCVSSDSDMTYEPINKPRTLSLFLFFLFCFISFSFFYEKKREKIPYNVEPSKKFHEFICKLVKITKIKNLWRVV